ncbi:MAG: RDD family protein [Acidimicrobiales bacterium]
MPCGNCQNQLQPGQRFCGRCGTEVRAESPAESRRAAGPPRESVLGARSVRPAPPLPSWPGEEARRPGSGDDAGSSSEYGAWWSRVVALVLDLIVVAIGLYIVRYLIAAAATGDLNGPQLPVAAVYAISFAGSAAYFSLTSGAAAGQTLGYRALRLAVRDAASGAPIGVWRAFLRYVVRAVLYALFVVPGVVNDLYPLWDRRHQTLADKAVGAVVVRR